MKLVNALFSKNTPKEIIKSKSLSSFSPLWGWGNFVNYYAQTFRDNNQPDWKLLFRELNGLFYRCVKLQADLVASAKPFIYNMENQSETTEPDNHPFLDILKRPNINETLDVMIAKLVWHLHAVGNNWWLKEKNERGILTSIRTLRTSTNNQMIVKTVDDNGYPVRWEYTNFFNKKIEYLNEQIEHFKFYSPFDPIYGMGTVINGSWVFDKLRAINEYQLRYYANDALKKFVIESDDEMGDQAFEIFQEEFNNNYQGTDNAGKPLILNKGLHAKVLSNSPVESDYSASYKDIRNDICALAGTPPSIANLIEDVNRANAIQAHPDFMTFTINPILRQIGSVLTKILQDSYKLSDSLIVELKLKRPEDRLEDRKDLELLLNAGRLGAQELRLNLGMDKEIKSGDFYLLPTKSITSAANSLTAN